MRNVILTLTLAATLAADANASHEVRVRQTPGGPRLFVDGRMRPPEMLSLREGNRTIRVTSEWREHVLPFVPHGDLRRTQVHISFKRPRKTGEIRLKGISVKEVDGAELGGLSGAFFDEDRFRASWQAWPPSAAPERRYELADGTLVQRLPGREDAANVPMPTFTSCFMSFKGGHRYEVRFAVRSDAVESIQVDLHTVDLTGRESPHHSLGEPDTTTEQVRRAAAAGVDLVSYMFVDWRKDGGSDFSFLDGVSDRILKANPKALLVPRFNVNAPDWWLKAHPDDLAKVEPGAGARMAASVSSERYRRDACGWIREIAHHMTERYPDNFAGLQINAQQTDEWFYFDSPGSSVGRESLAAREFGEAVPPVGALRESRTGDVVLKGPDADRAYRFNRFLQDRLTSFMAELAQTAREATASSKLVIMFYGYAFEHSCQPRGPANTGHYGVGMLIEKAKGAIDMIAAPVAYGNRGLCGMSSPMGVPDTWVRNGVIPMSENDTRTPLDALTPRALPDFRTAGNVLLREVAQDAIRGGGFWFFDLEGRGWWEAPELWEPLKRYASFRNGILKSTTPYVPDVAIVVGEESLWSVAAGSDFRRLLLPDVGESRLMPPKAGLSHGQYVLSDVVARGLESRVQLFPAAWMMTDAQVEALVRQRKERPAVRAWGWAAGLFDERGHADIKRMERLTGFRVKHCADTAPKLLPNELFTVEETPEVEVWQRWEDGTPSVAVRKDGDGWSVFCGLPKFNDPKFLHRLAVLAGTRPMLDAEEIGKAAVWRRDGCCLVQAQESGTVRLRMANGGVCEFRMEKGEVRLLDLNWKGSL